MKIPLAYDELGIWYPIGDSYWFCQLAFEYNQSKIGKYRVSSWREFKEAHPHLAYPTSDIRFRSKTSYKDRQKKV